MADVLFDARQIDQALAQHGRLHLLKVQIDGSRQRPRLSRQNQADQVVIEVIFNFDQRGGDINQPGLIRRTAVGHHRFDTRDL